MWPGHYLILVTRRIYWRRDCGGSRACRTSRVRCGLWEGSHRVISVTAIPPLVWHLSNEAPETITGCLRNYSNYNLPKQILNPPCVIKSLRIPTGMVISAAVIPGTNLSSINLTGVESSHQVLFAFRVRSTRNSSHSEMSPLSSRSFDGDGRGGWCRWWSIAYVYKSYMWISHKPTKVNIHILLLPRLNFLLVNKRLIKL